MKYLTTFLLLFPATLYFTIFSMALVLFCISGVIAYIAFCITDYMIDRLFELFPTKKEQTP